MAEELVTKEKFERTKSMLEAELRDIQERYFHMSLKYAEVEAMREELVMKLKATRKQKGWLSQNYDQFDGPLLDLRLLISGNFSHEL